MIVYKIKSNKIINNVFIPKYYDPNLIEDIENIRNTHDLLNLGDLIDSKIISSKTGHEIGKMSYGTGNIPFVRTSDISNWEIKTDTKQGVSNEIYLNFSSKEDVQPEDILMVKDGTYLVGNTCMVSELDIPMIFQSHIIKFRVENKKVINPYLFFLSLNCSIVQRQIKNRKFTADIIDTIGNRYKEILLPVPKDSQIREKLSKNIQTLFEQRVKYKSMIKKLPYLILETG